MKRTVFADTAFYVALLSQRDQYHASASQFVDSDSSGYVTTSAVITELANALSNVKSRQGVVDLWSSLQEDQDIDVVFVETELWRQGFNLYAARPDKSWSLTDCISFLVMQDRGLTAALTADHHFEQAGFTILLK